MTTFSKAKVEVGGADRRAVHPGAAAQPPLLSLGELNEAIREVLGDLNARLMRKLGASRREFFDTIDRPALPPLPTDPYAYAEWRRCRVAPRLPRRGRMAISTRCRPG